MRRMKSIDISQKMMVYSIIINVLQILGALTIALISVISRGTAFTGATEQLLLCVLTFIVCWGAWLDIRKAIDSGRIADDRDMVKETLSEVNRLNTTLRAQRHDFMNHLQVVYSLVELDEGKEAIDYIEKIYSDIRSVSRFMRTESPAVNALLAAKSAECESRHIDMQLEIESAWGNLAAEDYLVCRVLGNLIDNAVDALSGTQEPRITVKLSESVNACLFTVSNNGPRIPDDIREHIFTQGFSTKGEGRGMGLAICRSIMQKAEGELSVESDAAMTVFTGKLPKITAKDTTATESTIKEAIPQ